MTHPLHAAASQHGPCNDDKEQTCQRRVLVWSQRACKKHADPEQGQIAYPSVPDCVSNSNEHQPGRHDIGSEDTPLEAGLGFAVSFKKDAFVGRDALLRQREAALRRRLLTLVLDDPAALLLGDEPIYRDGVLVDRITSGAYGHTLGRSIGLVDDHRWARFRDHRDAIEALHALLRDGRREGDSLELHLRRPQTAWDDLVAWSPALAEASARSGRHAVEQVVIEAKYGGYIARQALELHANAARDEVRVRPGPQAGKDVTVNRAFSRRFFEALEADRPEVAQAALHDLEASGPLEVLDEADLIVEDDDEEAELDESDLIQT